MEPGVKYPVWARPRLAPVAEKPHTDGLVKWDFAFGLPRV